LRTLILGLVLIILGALALETGVQILQADTNGPASFLGLMSDPQSFPLLPVRVTGLVQKAFGRPIGPAETSLILALILCEAVAVGVVLELMLGERSYGLVVNALVALAGVWCVMLIYDFRADADASDELNALVSRALIASVAAPAAVFLIKAFVAADANTFFAGGDTRVGDALRSAIARVDNLASGAAGRRPKGPSAERIRGVTDRRRSS